MTIIKRHPWATYFCWNRALNVEFSIFCALRYRTSLKSMNQKSLNVKFPFNPTLGTTGNFASPLLTIHSKSISLWTACGRMAVYGVLTGEPHHAKRSLMAWVVVIPKEGRVRGAVPALILVWHWLFILFCREFDTFGFSSMGKQLGKVPYLSILIYERWAGAAPCAGPSFGMTTTQAIRDLLA